MQRSSALKRARKPLQRVHESIENLLRRNEEDSRKARSKNIHMKFGPSRRERRVNLIANTFHIPLNFEPISPFYWQLLTPIRNPRLTVRDLPFQTPEIYFPTRILISNKIWVMQILIFWFFTFFLQFNIVLCLSEDRQSRTRVSLSERKFIFGKMEPPRYAIGIVSSCSIIAIFQYSDACIAGKIFLR